ncbi:AraC family transcriptional regulator [Enterococcus florum]|uniref:AraC family transcriptional regulator n=1 Tax=Enterococcus florum TaxID=2480627 RepID=A0A4P5P5S5_9ENTE|nr:AraC family transcriptional regulator [Enterococcus florum]GCF93205.1 AraC family transcriptional regulator [Enterococcus florum]
MPKDIERFAATLSYIEDHLFEEISLGVLAKQALLSEYTFHRFFTYLTGYSFSTYVRNRRLSEAVDLLKNGNLTIDEISDQCGYANRSAFHRAFCKFHNQTPSQVKDSKANVHFFPPIRLKIQIEGGNLLNYRIERLPGFKMIGRMKQYELDEHLFNKTGKQWEAFYMDQSLRTLAESSAVKKNFFGANRAPYFAVGNPKTPKSGFLNYFTGFVLNQSIIDKHTILEIPRQTYVVFTSEPYDYRVTANVSAAYHRLQQSIFNSWLPQTKYVKTSGAELETYVSIENQACLEIWLPIKDEGVNVNETHNERKS